jgi:hypothetical protein
MSCVRLSLDKKRKTSDVALATRRRLRSVNKQICSRFVEYNSCFPPAPTWRKKCSSKPGAH